MENEAKCLNLICFPVSSASVRGLGHTMCILFCFLLDCRH
uniref:Uncharacterized protein n=1 Tax=Rhizophora mucronata TaxID=61149 RepID=A0A2P2JC25_RHIMU